MTAAKNENIALVSLINKVGIARKRQIQRHPNTGKAKSDREIPEINPGLLNGAGIIKTK
jgi:hypothetical protein